MSDSEVDVVVRRVRSVVERLDVALQFTHVDTSILHQACHAVEYALRGPRPRRDDDYLDVDADQALALVRALLPFVLAARNRPPPPEGG